MADAKENIKLLTDIEQNTADTAAAVTPAGTVTPGASPPTVVTAAGDTVATPTSTQEEDRATSGQRHINVMWESTQRNIALGVSFVALSTTAFLAVWPDGTIELRLMAYTTLSNVFFAVTSVYFTRTNHTRVGGVKYEGR